MKAPSVKASRPCHELLRMSSPAMASPAAGTNRKATILSIALLVTRAVSRRSLAMSRMAFGAVAMAAFVGAGLARAAIIEVQVHDAAGGPVADAVVFAVPSGAVADARGKSVA